MQAWTSNKCNKIQVMSSHNYLHSEAIRQMFCATYWVLQNRYSSTRIYSGKDALEVCDISKMAKWEVLDMPSPHKHQFSKNLQISFVSNPETNWKAAVSRANTKPDSLKLIEKLWTPSHWSPCPQHSHMIGKTLFSSQFLRGEGRSWFVHLASQLF